jgi:hypothetical protein
MKYIVSLVDNAKDLELLNIAARNMFTRAMMTKQELICGLEDALPIQDVIALSYKANKRLHNSIGRIALAYSQPMTLTIDDDGGAIGFDTIEYSVTVGHMAFTMMRDQALKFLAEGIADEYEKLSGQELTIFGSKEAQAEFSDIIDEFLTVVKAVFTKQTDEFIAHVKKTSSFSAKVTEDDLEAGFENAEVVVTLF